MAACGRKEKPYAPEDVVPQRIIDLTLFEEGEDIVLTWSIPRRNANGWTLKDLAGFKVLRKIEFAPYHAVGEVKFDERTERETVKRVRYRERRPTRADIPTDEARTLAEEVAKIREAEEAARKEAAEAAAGSRIFKKKPSELEKARNKAFYVVVSANESGRLSDDSNEVSFVLPPAEEGMK